MGRCWEREIIGGGLGLRLTAGPSMVLRELVAEVSGLILAICWESMMLGGPWPAGQNTLHSAGAGMGYMTEVGLLCKETGLVGLLERLVG